MRYLNSNSKKSAKNHDRAVRGAAVLEELKTLHGVWAGRIRAPGQKAKRNDGFTIHQADLIRTLRPLLDLPLIAYATPAQIAVLLNSYWTGIAKVLPEPFDAATNPQHYVIQKYPGATVLHSVLPQVIQVLPAWGRPLDDPIAYADVMHDLPTLSTEIIINHRVKLVSDAAFWLSGPAGAAAQFSRDLGRKHLSANVRALIPQPAEGLEI